MLGNFEIHNPGNIRNSKDKFVGEIYPSSDPDFKQFENNVYGYRAMFKILNTYRNYGYNTISDIIQRYAPPQENDTQGYIDFVSGNMGIPPYAQLNMDDKQTMLTLVANMTMMENGMFADMSEVEKGYNMANNIFDDFGGRMATDTGKKASLAVTIGILGFSALFSASQIIKKK